MKKNKLLAALMALAIGLPFSSWAQDCPPVNVWFVVDKSGSIDSAEFIRSIVLINEALSEWSSELEQGAIWIGAGSFAEGYQTNCRFGVLSDSLLACIQAVDLLDGATDIMNAMEMATYEFEGDLPRFAYGLNIIILCSDGLDMVRRPSFEEAREHRLQLEKRPPGFIFFSIDISEVVPNIERQHDEMVLKGYASDGICADGGEILTLQGVVKKIKKLANCQ